MPLDVIATDNIFSRQSSPSPTRGDISSRNTGIGISLTNWWVSNRQGCHSVGGAVDFDLIWQRLRYSIANCRKATSIYSSASLCWQIIKLHIIAGSGCISGKDNPTIGQLKWSGGGWSKGIASAAGRVGSGSNCCQIDVGAADSHAVAQVWNRCTGTKGNLTTVPSSNLLCKRCANKVNIDPSTCSNSSVNVDIASTVLENSWRGCGIGGLE